MKSGTILVIATLLLSVAVTCGRAADTVTYSYPLPPDEQHWNGAFQDPGGKKLLDGVAAGGAAHSVIWAATTDERFVDVDLGDAVVLDRGAISNSTRYDSTCPTGRKT